MIVLLGAVITAAMPEYLDKKQSTIEEQSSEKKVDSQVPDVSFSISEAVTRAIARAVVEVCRGVDKGESS